MRIWVSSSLKVHFNSRFPIFNIVLVILGFLSSELSTKKVNLKFTEWGLSFEGGGGKAADVIWGFQGMGQVMQVQKGQLAQKEKSANFKSPDLGSLAYTLTNYQQTLTQITFCLFFFLHPQLMFTGIRAMRPLREEISSMLFIFTPKELKWTVMRKN